MASSSTGEFEWGGKVQGSDSSYEQMRYRGTWYALYDCVHIRSDGEEPHVGKIMRMYEENGTRWVRVRWFMKGHELPFLVTKDLSGKNKKELYIGQGSVKGVENVNRVETIVRKVSVVCTARCSRNPQPSQQIVDGADYIFNKAYDAQERKLVKMDRIEKGLASKLFNQERHLKMEGPSP
ncbi:hypothetical protein M758_1G092200 [Ceratodon purpureus]|uniref:BAH domain-containing protein n=1 Tax=Ceratodon purpureus TaxID=3225 RepID=A0A8T0J5E3_CERPU|nr:hypothetical protein KC19_1G096500 [Ceratodon purpureus]KAG0629297.1 hypothetical protein M758_1G092200 [Ceratodon purpureus]